MFRLSHHHTLYKNIKGRNLCYNYVCIFIAQSLLIHYC